MPNKLIKHIVARIVGASTEETFDIYDASAIHSDDVYNGLDKADSGSVLDASQGKVLNDSLVASITASGKTVTYKNRAGTDLGTFSTQDTWRGIQNVLTSTSTTDSLSAAMGKSLQDNKMATENLKAGWASVSIPAASKQDEGLNAGRTNITVNLSAADSYFIIPVISGVAKDNNNYANISCGLATRSSSNFVVTCFNKNTWAVAPALFWIAIKGVGNS